LSDPSLMKYENSIMLWEIAKSLNSSLELDIILEKALEQVMKVVEAEAGTIWLRSSEDQDSLYPVLIKGPKKAELKNFKLKVGEGLVGWVTQNKQSQLIADVATDPRWSSRFDQSSGYKTRTLLCIPLTAQKSCIGCFQLVNKLKDKKFTVEDLELCETLSGIIAMAIDNGRLYTDLKTMLKGFLTTLSSALDARDPYTRGHSERVSQYSLMIGQAYNLSQEELEVLERAALLHDIGKIGINDSILQKQSALNQEEFAIMEKHTLIGEAILKEIKPVSMVKDLCLGANYHHERFDGSGYPHRIKDQEIPLIARIIAISDTFDAMTTDRPYRQGLSYETALNEIEKCSGTQFDPELARLFIKEMRKKIKNGSI